MACFYPRPTFWKAWRVGGVLLVLTALTGCQSGVGTLSRWRMARDKGLAKGVTAAEINDNRGMLARFFAPKPGPANDPNPKSTLVLGSDGWRAPQAVSDPDAEKELQAAEALFTEGKLPEAEKAYKAIAKDRKETSWGERAQFQLAEIQFQQGKLVAANDSYDELARTYAWSKFKEKAVMRQYDIAQRWLAYVEGLPQAAKEGDTKKEGDTTKPEAAKQATRFSWVDHFNGRLPLVDTAGHALQTLEHVRHNDVEGPLADDAVMRIADFHYTNENYEEASIYYDQLLNDHPKSQFVRRAQLASIDSKIKSYIGPEYDGSGLEKARDQIKQHLTTFPETEPGQNDSLYRALAMIKDQEAERAYKVGELYMRTGHVIAAEYSFGEIPVKWPNSEWAKRAKIELTKIEKMPRKETLSSKIMSQPGSSDPMTGGQYAGGGMGGMGGMSGASGGMGGTGYSGGP